MRTWSSTYPRKQTWMLRACADTHRRWLASCLGSSRSTTILERTTPFKTYDKGVESAEVRVLERRPLSSRSRSPAASIRTRRTSSHTHGWWSSVTPHSRDPPPAQEPSIEVLVTEGELSVCYIWAHPKARVLEVMQDFSDRYHIEPLIDAMMLGLDPDSTHQILLPLTLARERGVFLTTHQSLSGNHKVESRRD